jgi:hypothetical protein
MVTIYQLYINGIPQRYVYKNENEAIEMKNKLSLLYRKIEIISFNVRQN